MKNQQKPWIKKDGDTFSDQELLEVTQQWGGDDWEDFLSSTVEKPLLETLPNDPGFIENCENNYRQAYQGMLAKSDHPNLKVAIQSILKNLTAPEQRVIYEFFWQGKSMRTMAREMGVSKWSIETYKSRALAKLGFLFLENFSMKAKCSNSSKKLSDRFSGQKPIGKEEVSTDQVVGA